MRGSFIATNVTPRIALVVICVTMMAHGTARANLLTNGSFESGPGTNGLSVDGLQPGDTSITGWVVTRGEIDYAGTDFWSAADGLYALDLNGSPGIGGIEQTFSTVSGQVYSVTFDMAGNPSRQGLMTMAVQAAGQSDSFSFSTVGHDRISDMGWVSKSWLFTAVDPQTTLEFYSTFTASQFEGPALDNVSVVVIPEPSSAPLVLASLVLLGLMRKGRKIK
jgi:choice-of-anchor C domain-containing protein